MYSSVSRVTLNLLAKEKSLYSHFCLWSVETLVGPRVSLGLESLDLLACGTSPRGCWGAHVGMDVVHGNCSCLVAGLPASASQLSDSKVAASRWAAVPFGAELLQISIRLDRFWETCTWPFLAHLTPGISGGGHLVSQVRQ